MKTLGVIGGMGPAATFDFCARLTAAMPAARDQDHPRILVECDPSIPDRNAAIRGDGPSPAPRLAAIAADLISQGAQVLAMPCNTAHAFRAAVDGAAPGALVCMITATLQETVHTGATRIGLLAADGCLSSGLYQTALTQHALTPVLLPPDAQRRFMALIYRIKSGDIGETARAGMQAAAQRLVDAGADAVIAGCTEVPLVLHPGDAPAPVISSTDALMRATIKRLCNADAT
jgi:aspartate racemase